MIYLLKKRFSVTMLGFPGMFPWMFKFSSDNVTFYWTLLCESGSIMEVLRRMWTQKLYRRRSA